MHPDFIARVPVVTLSLELGVDFLAPSKLQKFSTLEGLRCHFPRPPFVLFKRDQYYCDLTGKRDLITRCHEYLKVVPWIKKLHLSYVKGFDFPDELPADLEEVSLNNCFLTEVPACVLALSKLKGLNLSSNEGICLPERLPASIEFLSLAGCRLTEIPACVLALPHLKTLNLMLDNTIPRQEVRNASGEVVLVGWSEWKREKEPSDDPWAAQGFVHSRK